MAIIKQYKGTRIGSSTRASWFTGSGSTSIVTDTNYVDLLEDQNFALIEDANDNTLYFADSSNDAVNLNPNYNKKVSFAKHMKKNLLHGFSASLLHTTKPKIQAKFNQINTANDFQVRSTQLENLSFLSNLDIDDAYASSNFYQFQLSGDRYSIFVIPDRDGIGAGNPASNTYTTTCGSQVILAKGDDLSTAEYIQFGSDYYAFDLLTVNVEEQLIYLKSNIYYSTSSDRNLADYPSEIVHVLPFKVTSLDGEFSFDDLILLFGPKTYAGLVERGSRVGIYYIGRNSADKDCFLTVQNTEYYFSTKQDYLQLHFFKIDYATLKTATTTTNYSNNTFSVLDCVENHSINLAADQTVLTDYDWQHNPIPTKLQNFNDSLPNDYWFYIPMFKNNGYFSPIAINWHKGESVWANSFDLHEDLITTDTTSVLVNPLDYTGNSGLTNNIAAFLAHTYSYITSSNDLHFTFNFMDKALFDEIIPNQTTLLTNTASFVINPADPRDITFTGVSNIPSLNSMLLKDETNNSYNELICITSDSLKSYYYTRANGWTASYSEPGLFSELAVDSYSRRWAIESPLYSSADRLMTHGYAYLEQYNVNLHLISQVLPYTTSVAFQNTNLTYSDTDINNNLIINAYDEQGSRIAINVIVNIEGTNMVFTTDNSTVTEITTSANSDTILQVTITGPGYANVSVSFDI